MEAYINKEKLQVVICVSIVSPIKRAMRSFLKTVKESTIILNGGSISYSNNCPISLKTQIYSTLLSSPDDFLFSRLETVPTIEGFQGIFYFTALDLSSLVFLGGSQCHASTALKAIVCKIPNTFRICLKEALPSSAWFENLPWHDFLRLQETISLWPFE